MNTIAINRNERTQINLGDYQNPQVKYTRKHDRVNVTSGNCEFSVNYLEFYLLLLWARKMHHTDEVLSLKMGDVEFVIEPPTGVTVKQRIRELLEGAREIIAYNLDEPNTYLWDDEEIVGTDVEHVYLRLLVTSYRPVLALSVTVPEGMSKEDSLAYLEHSIDTINEHRALPRETENLSIIHSVKDATPSILGIGKRPIFNGATSQPYVVKHVDGPVTRSIETK